MLSQSSQKLNRVFGFAVSVITMFFPPVSVSSSLTLWLELETLGWMVWIFVPMSLKYSQLLIFPVQLCHTGDLSPQYCLLPSGNQPVHSKGNQSWVFIGKTDAETPILWPPDMKSRFIGQDPEGKKRRGQQRIRWLNGIADPTDMSLSKLWERWWRTGKPDMLQSTGSQRVGHNLVTKQQEHKDALRLSRRPQVKI